MHLAALLVSAALLASCQQRAAPGTPEAGALLGTWTVDLRPTPSAPAYYQEFVVTSVAGDTLVGTFYGTAITHGRINRDWGALHFAFVTSDGAGPYNTTGVLSGDQLRGTTHSLGRNFLAVWTAARKR